jgi:hypothetical protein
MVKLSLDLNSQTIYFLLILVVTIPVLSHTTLPVPVSNTTKAVYQFIENLAKTKPNSLVVLSFDYSTSNVPELHPQAIVVTQQIFNLPLKVIFVAQWTDGPALTNAVLDVINKGSKKYGVDYATLGYIPNVATLIGMTTNIQKFFPIDTRGNPTSSLQIIQQFPAAKNASFLMTFTGGEPGLDNYLQYWQTPFKIPTAVGATAISAPGYMPFYNSKQIVGILISERAAAEYEFLTNEVDLSGAVSAMVAQSTSLLLIVVLVILGNVQYFVRSRTVRKGKEK